MSSVSVHFNRIKSQSFDSNNDESLNFGFGTKMFFNQKM
jgi:hypothetical protein